ncbi:hypothetical protein AHAS_Ahas11G0132600 [Arachis hypogaea]
MEFVTHSISPTSNRSELIVARTIMVYCIMIGEEERLDKIIPNEIFHFASNPHPRAPLGFPSIIHCLCEATGIFIQNDIPIELGKPITKRLMEKVKTTPLKKHKRRRFKKLMKKKSHHHLHLNIKALKINLNNIINPLIHHNKR